jgi:hypothetical protein
MSWSPFSPSPLNNLHKSRGILNQIQNPEVAASVAAEDEARRIEERRARKAANKEERKKAREAAERQAQVERNRIKAERNAQSARNKARVAEEEIAKRNAEKARRAAQSAAARAARPIASSAAAGAGENSENENTALATAIANSASKRAAGVAPPPRSLTTSKIIEIGKSVAKFFELCVRLGVIIVSSPSTQRHTGSPILIGYARTTPYHDALTEHLAPHLELFRRAALSISAMVTYAQGRPRGGLVFVSYAASVLAIEMERQQKQARGETDEDVSDFIYIGWPVATATVVQYFTTIEDVRELSGMSFAEVDEGAIEEAVRVLKGIAKRVGLKGGARRKSRKQKRKGNRRGTRKA